jgi:MerR family transcriptional regulator, mercuric resistance operon regulatory protein
MATKAADGLSIGALSKQSGVNIETIRYYERIGVMPSPKRNAGGYRIFGPDHLKRLTFVRRDRELGFSLDELRGSPFARHEAPCRDSPQDRRPASSPAGDE